MAKVLRIEMCYECPYWQEPQPGDCYCGKQGRAIPCGRKEIPEGCPLKDEETGKAYEEMYKELGQVTDEEEKEMSTQGEGKYLIICYPDGYETYIIRRQTLEEARKAWEDAVVNCAAPIMTKEMKLVFEEEIRE